MITVSVIIPTFNRYAFVKAAIDSVLAQTFQDVEILLIDDGSTDPTAHLQDYHPALRYYFQDNQGVASARNLGLREARGRFVAFLDSDDAWLPDKLARSLAFFDAHPSYWMMQTDEVWVRRGQRVNPMTKHTKQGGWIFAQCLSLCLVSPSCVLAKRELFKLVGTFDESFPVCEDYELWLRVASRMPIGFLAQKLVVKQGGHPDQLSRRYTGMDRFRIRALEKILNANVLNETDREAAIAELERKCQIYGYGCVKHGKRKEGEHYLHLPNLYKNKHLQLERLTKPSLRGNDPSYAEAISAPRLLRFARNDG